MSASAPYSYFRRPTIGRAGSPPTWACYEQIPDDEDEDEYSDSDSGSESCSEDDEDYSNSSDENELNRSDEGPQPDTGGGGHNECAPDDSNDLHMDIDGDVGGEKKNESLEDQKDVKGKQRAVEVEPEPESKKKHHHHHHHRRRRQLNSFTLRPILTIQRSQGFVWNQDLFIPPYIKDRYIASTSPPNSSGFVSTSVSSTNSEYEAVEVVEIRVKEGELQHIIP